MKLMWLALFVLVGLVVAVPEAHAQKNCAAAVPPSGASIDVTTHPAYMTTVSLWEPLGSQTALGTLVGYEVSPLPPRGFGIHPENVKAGPGNMTITTKSGVKISIAVSVVPDKAEACSFVTIDLVTEAEAFTRRVDLAVEERTLALEQELSALRRELDERVRSRIDDELARRSVVRRSLERANHVDRSADDLIVRVGEILYLGDGAVIAFEIQNRRKATVTVEAVSLIGKRGDEAAAVALDRAPAGSGLGQVTGNGVTRGTVVVRSVARLRDQKLTLTVRPAAGQGGPVAVKGVVLE